MQDVYFEPAYGKLCEYVDHGVYEGFCLSTENGCIRNAFIKRAVPWLIDGKQYYDIVTPYGYGGPVICQANDHDRLISEYEIKFRQYCLDNNIVCEFIRFHPIIENFLDFTGVYDVAYSRHTVGTNLKDFEDPVQSEFSKNARKEVRKAVEAGVTCVVHENPNDLSEFKRLYTETMNRNQAADMYYFPDEYYRLLTTELREAVLEIQAVCCGEVWASEIYFIGGTTMHAHLLGSDHRLLDVGGGAIIEAFAARWGKENGYSYIHHGGGRTSAADDSLYLYKKKFGKHTQFDFYTGKRVWNQEIYDRLLAEKAKTGVVHHDYFPAYR